MTPRALFGLAAALLLAADLPTPTAAELAVRIDRRVDAALARAKITPAPLADDAEFCRRVALDLTGRIPRVADVRAFLADPAADKRSRLIDRLLADPRFAIHFANVWRADLAPEIAAERGAAIFQAGFEAWLRGQIRAGVGYDRLTRDLLAVPLAAAGSDGVPVLRDPDRPNPLAFFAVKEARPENLAAAVTRTFLGIRLECAQCHDHPFAPWKQEQFWAQAAFFAGIERQGGNLFGPLAETLGRRELTPPGRKQPQPAAFLDGGAPRWRDGVSPRVVLAEWIAAPTNPYFARAAANRLWGQLFGTGLVEPVDDFRDDNPASDPELLDELATAYRAARFDPAFLLRAICLSKAYQRTSARTHATQDGTPLPARMRPKALTGEQWFDSIALATGYRSEQDNGAARRQFLTRFALVGSVGEPETSVQQALTLLNGRFVQWATDPEQNPTLIAAMQTPNLTLAERIDTLYLAALGRLPSAAERDRTTRYIAPAGSARQAERLADLFWVLLNSAEFRLNH